ncbi:RteC domain-containing protein [Dysgonomonas sp. Marseille-P4677]|nr:RteC domain-containing protein [Dysgonomonas sp. Marseille-P4677]MBK5722012.1 RteC domain-containing protein [Dysgonomonas sp. Marseille-P4677]
MYIQKVIAIIDFELVLLDKLFSYPERFIQKQIFKSDLYIIPKSKDLGIVGLSEIVESLYLSQKILNAEGKPASRKQIANIFELMFNTSFGDISDKTSEIYKRKPFNRTKTLDFLRNMIMRKDKVTR